MTDTTCFHFFLVASSQVKALCTKTDRNSFLTDLNVIDQNYRSSLKATNFLSKIYRPITN